MAANTKTSDEICNLVRRRGGSFGGGGAYRLLERQQIEALLYPETWTNPLQTLRLAANQKAYLPFVAGLSA